MQITKKRAFRLDGLKALHRTTCILSTLLIACSLYMCVCRFVISLIIFRTENVPDNSYSFQFWLRDTNFYLNAVFFLLATVELVLYVFLCFRAERKCAIRWGIWYLGVMLAIHAVICIHAYSLPIPKFVVMAEDEVKKEYRFFASLTALPAALYEILYIWRIGKYNAREKQNKVAFSTET